VGNYGKSGDGIGGCGQAQSARAKERERERKKNSRSKKKDFRNEERHSGFASQPDRSIVESPLNGGDAELGFKISTRP